MTSTVADAEFLAKLQEQARATFLLTCPIFTIVVVGWTVFDAVLAPSWWWTFLAYRLLNVLVSSVLFMISWRRWSDRHMWLLLVWALSIAAAIAPMLPVVSEDAFPFYVMGFSLTTVGMTTFVTTRLKDAGVALVIYLVLFLPTLVVRPLGGHVVVGSLFFLITLVLASLFQVRHRHRMARDGWEVQMALAQARDEALAADHAKSSFLARMSHELRTPLNAIIGYAELVDEELPAGAEAHEDLARIEHAGRHLLALINDVLDLSKVAAGELEVLEERVDVAACVEEVHPLAERLAGERGNRLEWAVDGQSVAIADPLRLRQVVLNLVSNAAKFTHRGTIRVRVHRDGESVVIDVVDDGIGMDAAGLERAFLPFVQVHQDHATYGGTGLGLAVSRQLADRMRGSLTAQSQLGTGSRFRLTLPGLVDATP